MFNRLPFQIMILLLAGLLLGVVNNSISPNRIAWVEEYQDLSKITKTDTVWIPYSWEESDSVFELLNLAKAYKMYSEGEALFVDARIPQDYEYGHIAGAINLDFETDDDSVFNAHYERLLELADYNRPIVTYCAGTECDASLMLARYLHQEGFTHVYIYFGGWEFWSENGFPIDSVTENE
jgi:rhodanese-related sulfurtransferase